MASTADEPGNEFYDPWKIVQLIKDKIISCEIAPSGTARQSSKDIGQFPIKGDEPIIIR